jgi:hypothetical protein
LIVICNSEKKRKEKKYLLVYCHLRYISTNDHYIGMSKKERKKETKKERKYKTRYFMYCHLRYPSTNDHYIGISNILKKERKKVSKLCKKLKSLKKREK